MRAKQSAQAGACALVVAILLAGCGGGAVDPTPATSVTALARALPATDTGVPLVAEAAAAPQAVVAWTPTGETVMEWAEATYPQHFPAGPWNRFWSGFTYRQYTQTGNILAYSGQGVYVLGPVHCRIGSSENRRRHQQRRSAVHCRIGSSERWPRVQSALRPVHCRIGSSEKQAAWAAPMS